LLAVVELHMLALVALEVLELLLDFL